MSSVRSGGAHELAATYNGDESLGGADLAAARLGGAAVSAQHQAAAGALDDRYTRDPVEAFAREAQGFRMLSDKEVDELAARIQSGDQEARNRLVEANLRLVLFVARLYNGRGVPMDALIGEGNVGLIIAANKYDPNHGASFGTYSIYWVHQAIARAVAQDAHPVHLPDFAVHGAWAMQRAANTFAVAHEGRMPTDVELAAEMGVSLERLAIYNVAYVIRHDGLASLDRPLTRNGEPGVVALGDLLSDHSSTDAFADAEARLDSVELYERMEQLLTPQEWKVITLRFGLDGGGERTNAAVARRIGLTRERVRQVCESALAKLRVGLADQSRSLRGED